MSIKTLIQTKTAFETASEAFTASLANLETTTAHHNGSREAAKATGADLKAAERVSLWLLFDAAILADHPADVAEGFALEYGIAKGVGAASLPVYAMRGRDMMAHQSLLSAMTVEQRGKENPMTVAKKAREAKVAMAERVAMTVAHIGPAKDAVADRLGVSRDMLDAMIDAGDELVRVAVSETIELRMADMGILTTMAASIDAYGRSNAGTRADIRAKWEAIFAAE